MAQYKTIELTTAEKQEPYADLLYLESASIDKQVLRETENGPGNPNSAMQFNCINDLLAPGYLPMENGYVELLDGSVFVAILTPMPNVTGEMIDWWFWWHPLNSLRYKIWYPQAHFSTKLDVDQKEYINRKGPYRERYWNTTNYPVEDIGTGTDTLSITFIPPEEFGFDTSRFDKGGVETVVCAKVGSVGKKLTQLAKMCHFVRKSENGVEMRSRFWIGHKIQKKGMKEDGLINTFINKPMIKKRLIPKGIGHAMAMHCAQEYSNLASILPDLFYNYKDT